MRKKVNNMDASFIISGLGAGEHQDAVVEMKEIISQFGRSQVDMVSVRLRAQEYPEEMFYDVARTAKDAKIRRCMERAQPGENLSPKEIERNMRRIDKNRASSRELICDRKWADHESYHLIVNTTDWNIKELVPAVAAFAYSWFQKKL